MSLPSELAARDPDRPEVSVVVPVYNEEAGLAAFWARLAPVLASLAGTAEVVFVDDGSSDGTLAQLLSLRQLDRRVRIVSPSRHFGEEIALTRPRSADGNAVIPIDADLQHPPRSLANSLRAGATATISSSRCVATARPTAFCAEPRHRCFTAFLRDLRQCR
jgi:glycosyltransferase involved in cell wall biosynthesis